MTTETGGAWFPRRTLPSYPRPTQAEVDALDKQRLLDYFAGQALAGLCANGNPPRVNGVVMRYDQAAYMIAAAMLTERAKRAALPEVPR